MLIGLFTCQGGYKSQFDLQLTKTYDYIKLDNMFLDEVYCSNWENVGFDTNKLEWNEYTCFLGEFKDSLECGNFHGIAGKDITHIAFLKRLAYSDDDWVTLDILEYNMNDKVHLYTIYDKLAFAGEYEYGIQPLVIEEGHCYGDCLKGEITSKIEPFDFSNLFITDGKTTVCLKFELDYGDIKNNISQSEHLTIGRKYPVIQQIAETDYDSGSITAKILSYGSTNGSSRLNNVEDFKLCSSIKSFLNKGKNLLMKDGNGLKYIVVTKNVNIKTTKEFGGGFLDLSFDWIQQGDGMNNQDLIDTDLLKDFTYYPLLESW